MIQGTAVNASMTATNFTDVTAHVCISHAPGYETIEITSEAGGGC